MTVSSTRTTVVSNLSNFVGHICAVLRFVTVLVPYEPGFIVLLTLISDHSANRYFGLLQYVSLLQNPRLLHDYFFRFSIVISLTVGAWSPATCKSEFYSRCLYIIP
jgi:hypothetical protein